APLLVAGAQDPGTDKPAAGQKADLPEGQALLDRFIEASGGKEAFEKIKNRVTRGTVELVGMGFTGSMISYSAAPCHHYEAIEFSGMPKAEKGTDGAVAWERNARGVKVLAGLERAIFLRTSTMPPYESYKLHYSKVECTGTETVGEHPCYRVMMTPNEGEPETWFFDREKGLLRAMHMPYPAPMGSVLIKISLQDYREVDGLLLPHRVENKLPGAVFAINVTTMEHNVEMPEDRFAIPEDVKALLEMERAKKASEAEKEGKPEKAEKEGEG
ncbi:MAG: hypothetical protein ACE5GW_13280, partial [Planctomycetota bacterium]